MPWCDRLWDHTREDLCFWLTLYRAFGYDAAGWEDRTMASLSGTLRRAMERSGLTLYRIMKDTGIDYTTVFEFYHGRRDVRLRSAARGMSGHARLAKFSTHRSQRSPWCLERGF